MAAIALSTVPSLNQLLTDVLQFCLKVNSCDLEDSFSLRLTTVYVRPEYRGTVHELGVVLKWKAKDFDPEFRKEFQHYEWSPCRDYWDEVITHLPHLNIRVVRFQHFWEFIFSIPREGCLPEWVDKERGPVKERRPSSQMSVDEYCRGRF
jgi:hypothetical protein